MKPMNDVTKRLLIALGAVLVVSIAFVAFSRNTSPPEPAEDEPDLVEHVDEEAGFSVSYPSHWRRVRAENEDPLERLLVAPPGTDDSLSVKVVPLPGRVVIDEDTPQEDIDALQASLDQLIDQLPGLEEILQRQRLVVNGTPGWYYVYRFRDGEEVGIHFRYFLFEDDKEFVLTFQAFPESHYFDLAPVWDRMLATFNFKIDEASPSPGGSPGAAPATSPETPASPAPSPS